MSPYIHNQDLFDQLAAMVKLAAMSTVPDERYHVAPVWFSGKLGSRTAYYTKPYGGFCHWVHGPAVKPAEPDVPVYAVFDRQAEVKIVSVYVTKAQAELAQRLLS